MQPSHRVPDRSLLLLTYGQSNADGFIAGPRPDAALLADRRVLTTTRGTGLRGPAYLPDGSVKDAVGMFHRDGKRLSAADLGTFHPLAEHDHRNCSLLHVAGSILLDRLSYDRVYARVFARGGARLVGKPAPNGVVTGIYRLADGSLSPILEDLCASAQEMASHARADGYIAEDAYILFIHGEADRTTPRQDYLAAFFEAKSYVDDRLAACGLRPKWLLTQSAGTGAEANGNDWLSRQACLDIAGAAADNLEFLGPLYPYPLIDSVHHDAAAKMLIGELAAHAIESLESGLGWNPPMPMRWWCATESEVMIEVGCDDPLAIHPHADKFENLGFSLHSREKNRILGVELAGDRVIKVALEGPIKGPLRLDYAFRRREAGMRDISSGFPFGGGSIRTTWAADSVLLPGQRMFMWLPGFRIEIANGQTSGTIVEP
ncbi:hypothetical protein MU516_17035 [Paracoccus sp. YLB-12]|uniref:Sialate O-acetylesterase domain-containing protein n=1 Tax=Paracoccus maritimus TaxID=2933292 RepID=A0ABT2KDE1_9RHOB|nr:hypothetical protein [Paracoccus sp. YLB-12]MCT4334562.1 hypothetical protein [Paracoccus sp. YLB-12]